MISLYQSKLLISLTRPLKSVSYLYSCQAYFSKMPKPGFYAVKTGRVPGIYNTWSECEAQVKGFPNASYKKFPTLDEASKFIGIPTKSKPPISRPANSSSTINKRTTNRSTILIPPINRNPEATSTAPKEVPLEIKDDEFWCEDFDSSGDFDALLAAGIDENQVVIPSGPRQTFYAVHRGLKPGVYRTWTECEAQIKTTKNASYRKFDNKEQAEEYVKTGGIVKATKRELEQDPSIINRVRKKLKYSDNNSEVEYILEKPNSQVIIYTDGASSENGKKRARAGIGVYWGPDHPLNASKRLTGRQTNNRAEIHAAVYALNQAKQIGAKRVKLYTDSQFLIHSITDWIKKWKQNGWKLVNGQDVVNKDDFLELEAVSEGLDIEWVYVRAHARNFGNEEADRLAVAGARLLLEPKNCSTFPKPIITNLPDKIEPFIITGASSSNQEVMPLIIPEADIPRNVYYAVHKGKKPGVYTTWTECEEQVKDWVKPFFRKFNNKEEAEEFAKTGKVIKRVLIPDYNPDEFVTVYTDGASSCNGQEDAKAGIGVYWGPGNELNTSMRLPGRQTNNRAEIFAAVQALRQAKQLGIKNVRLYTDSKFVINGITSWIEKWKKNDWKSANGKPVVNKEDFMALDAARTGLNVDWCYVKGHDNNPGNVEADKLAVLGCSKDLSDAFVIA